MNPRYLWPTLRLHYTLLRYLASIKRFEMLLSFFSYNHSTSSGLRPSHARRYLEVGSGSLALYSYYMSRSRAVLRIFCWFFMVLTTGFKCAEGFTGAEPWSSWAMPSMSIGLLVKERVSLVWTMTQSLGLVLGWGRANSDFEGNNKLRMSWRYNFDGPGSKGRVKALHRECNRGKCDCRVEVLVMRGCHFLEH